MTNPNSLDKQTFFSLNMLIFGPESNENDFLRWFRQGFFFSPQINFGLLQKVGGPCGVLVAVQV